MKAALCVCVEESEGERKREREREGKRENETGVFFLWSDLRRAITAAAAPLPQRTNERERCAQRSEKERERGKRRSIDRCEKNERHAAETALGPTYVP